MPDLSDGFQERSAQQRGEELFRVHHAAVLAYVRRRAPAEGVDDVVAETFLVAWRRFERVPVDQPLPWLLGVARNVLATHRRGSGRRSALSARLSSRWTELAGQPPDSNDWCLAEGQGGPVTAALARLREKDREAVTLIAWEGLRPSEAAAVLGESPGAFRVRLHRARGRLRLALEDPREIELSAASRTATEGETQ